MKFISCLILMPWVKWHVPLQLVVHLQKEVSEANLQKIEDFIAFVPSGKDSLAERVRNFGDDKQHEGGHRMTFLHRHVEENFPSLVDLLWSMARRADSKAHWGVGGPFGRFSPRLGLRCLEVITYDAAKEVLAEGSSAEYSSLGWHPDGHTMMTLAVALTTPGVDFEGGELDARRRKAGTLGKDEFDYQSITDLRRGDAAIWRGWHEHRVRAVTAGTRRVLVAEFWTGPDAMRSGQPRGSDNEAGYRAALAVDPAAVEMRMGLARLLKDEGRLKAAVEEYKAAAMDDPNYYKPHRALGVIYEKEGKKKAALHAYTREVELNPRSSKAFNNKGRALFALGDHTGAMATLKAGLVVDSKDAEIWRNIGVLYRKQGRHDKAYEAFETSLRMDPSDAGGHLSLAELAEEKGDIAKAEQHYQGGIQAEPKNARPLTMFGAFLGRQKRWREAREPLRVALQIEPKNERAKQYYQAVLSELKSEPTAAASER